MKNGEILELYEAIDKISKQSDLILPVKVGFALAKNKKILKEEAQVIYEERNKIIYKYGELVENDWIVRKDKISDCNKEIEELMGMECGEIKVYFIPFDWIQDLDFNFDIIEALEPIILIEETIIGQTGPAIEKTQEK